MVSDDITTLIMMISSASVTRRPTRGEGLEPCVKQCPSLWYYCIVMARITFSLDDATVAQIRQTAARLKTPQSHVVREAVADYAARTDRLSERERQQMLGVLERLRGAKPTRPAADVDAEIREIRAARTAGGRRHAVK